MKKIKKTESTKEQISYLVRGVAKLLKTAETKDDAQKRYGELSRGLAKLLEASETKQNALKKHVELIHRIERLERTSATKDDLKAFLTREEMKVALESLAKEITDHIGKLFESHSNSHLRLNQAMESIERRLSVLERS